MEEHRDFGERVEGERGGEGDELSSIAHTGSQQSGGNVTVDSNMDSHEGRVCNGATMSLSGPITAPVAMLHHAVNSSFDDVLGGVSGGPTSSQPVPNTIPQQNQHHPLEIAHKMLSLQQTARHTTTTSEPSRIVPVPSQPPFVQESSHNTGRNIVSRNQRLRKLPPGRYTSAGMSSCCIVGCHMAFIS